MSLMPESSEETPTADSAERYLRTSPVTRDLLFESRAFRGSEKDASLIFKTLPAYSLRYSMEYYGRAYKDSFAFPTAFFQLAERIGFNISYKETPNRDRDEFRWLEAFAVYVDSEETRKALVGLQFSYWKYDIYEILHGISQRSPSALEDLALGNYESLIRNANIEYRLLPANYPSIELLAKRSFLVAYQRNMDRRILAVQHGLALREPDSLDLRHRELVQRFLDEGLSPLTPMEFEALVFYVAQHVFVREPHYGPPKNL